MSSLSQNDSDNESLDSEIRNALQNDSDNGSFESEIRNSLSLVTFQNHGTPDSNSELIRLGLISQQSQSQLTPQSQTQPPRSPHEGDGRFYTYKKILAHKGFFTKKDKEDVFYKNCEYSVKLDWDDGSTSWVALSGDVDGRPDVIADYIIENDLFELTKKSKLWGSESVINEIKNRREACDKLKYSNKRKRKDCLTQYDTPDKTPRRDRSRRRR